MTTLGLTLLPLLYCVVAAPLNNNYNSEDKPISNLQLLVPLPMVGSRSPSESPRDYWMPDKLLPDGTFSSIPSNSFALDETVNYFTEPPKKTVKKDLSRLEQAPLLKTPRVQVLDPEPSPATSESDNEYQIARCQLILRLLLKRIDPRTSSNLNPNELRSLCLLQLHDTKLSDDNVFRTYTNANKVLKSKRPTSATSFLASLLGGEPEHDGGELVFENSGKDWKGQLGNLGINGHGGYAGNLGVGGKGRDVGNLAVGGKGGLYGNLGIGGQGALFGNLGISGGGGEYDDAFNPKDSWTDHYQNGLLHLLLGHHHGKSMFGSGHEEDGNPKISHPVTNNQDFSESNSVAHDNLVPGKELDNSGTDHKSRMYGKFDNNAYGRVLDNVLLSGPHSEPAEGDKDGLNKQAYNKQIKDIRTLQDQKPIGRDLCDKNDNRCSIRSLLLGGRGGLIGNLAIDGYDYQRWSEQPPVRVLALALVGDGLIPNEMRYRPVNGRREWTVIGGKHDKLLRQYVNKNKPWVIV